MLKKSSTLYLVQSSVMSIAMSILNSPSLAVVHNFIYSKPSSTSWAIKKRATLFSLFRHNSDVSLSIFTLFVTVNTGRNTLLNLIKIYHLTLTMSRLYLIKTRKHKTAHIDVSVEYQSASKFKCLLQGVLKMSAFCSDAGCQTMAPLINGSVNNVLFQNLPDGYQTLPKFISVLNPLLICALFHNRPYRIIDWI